MPSKLSHCRLPHECSQPFNVTSPGFPWDRFGWNSSSYQEHKQPMMVLSLCWDWPDDRDVPEVILEILIHFWSRLESLRQWMPAGGPKQPHTNCRLERGHSGTRLYFSSQCSVQRTMKGVWRKLCPLVVLLSSSLLKTVPGATHLCVSYLCCD